MGEKRAELFAKLGIKSVEDMLYFFPRDYEDRTNIVTAAEAVAGENACIEAVVFSPLKERRVRKNLTVCTLLLSDDTGSFTAVWYNNRFLKDKFIPGERYVFFGRIERSGSKIQMITPVFEKVGIWEQTGRIMPVYPLTGSLTQNIIRSAAAAAVAECEGVEDILPDKLRKKYCIAEINYSVKNIHFPKTFDDYYPARERFVFEELLILQLALLLKKEKTEERLTESFDDTECADEFIKNLPFTLTEAQIRTIEEIKKDLSLNRPMNRLVQGDVGSGKTAVAAAAMFMAKRNGFQSAIMAPTEVLARQHYKSFEEFFRGLGINCVLLTGGLSAKEKKRICALTEDGSADVIIGTHAIIRENVYYKRLGLVVTDEQHRFGVSQRAALGNKGNFPHTMIMSATPIPRTLALILYGDLDISVIDELPPGRKTVKTYAVTGKLHERMYGFMDKQVRDGRQGYIVCPLIDETIESDMKNASELAERLEKEYPHIKFGLLHGRMRPKMKDEIMREFVENKIQVLVSTTVIEVGVNVPNANIMIIENAERFGLSQLHQLRGRVGRGAEQAYCILVTDSDSEITKKRMRTMCESNDGFYISEQDLKQRGPGDFFGVRQHGLPELRIANLFEDMPLLRKAQIAANEITESGEINGGEYAALKNKAEHIFSENIVLN
ncbi:MAG: ATP-dependent DNA helicase RecG [Oscillospiraceae bacterium]|nr:ATP-dependent DNA helicase RecG [Oscillospiraceae bacterium]